MKTDGHPVFCHGLRLAQATTLYHRADEWNAYGDGYEDGAAAMAGLIGMAWEIYFSHSCPACTFVSSERTCPQCKMVNVDEPSPLAGDPTKEEAKT